MCFRYGGREGEQLGGGQEEARLDAAISACSESHAGRGGGRWRTWTLAVEKGVRAWCVKRVSKVRICINEEKENVAMASSGQHADQALASFPLRPFQWEVSCDSRGRARETRAGRGGGQRRRVWGGRGRGRKNEVGGAGVHVAHTTHNNICYKTMPPQLSQPLRAARSP